ncbi:MAG: helix-turn-helix transcriptional regulator [Candidatus Bathyarchaeia archaeon]
MKETVVEVKDELEALLVRVHANIMRREIPVEEKQEWVREARRILQKRGLKGTQKEIAEALGVSESWVRKYDTREGFARIHNSARRADIVNSTIDNTNLEAFLRNYAEALKRMPKPDNDDKIEKFIAFAKRFFEENDVHCPICGEKRLVWRCGHEF